MTTKTIDRMMLAVTAFNVVLVGAGYAIAGADGARAGLSGLVTIVFVTVLSRRLRRLGRSTELADASDPGRGRGTVSDQGRVLTWALGLVGGLLVAVAVLAATRGSTAVAGALAGPCVLNVVLIIWVRRLTARR
jgi:hypothetical protein